jgi:hypothetical protein
MGQGRFCVLAAMAVGLMALAFAGNAGAGTTCASQLLNDWKDGRIDQTYPVSCYRDALADLPEDVRVYSTAQNDITRALQARIGAQAARSTDSSSHHSGVSPLLVVAITAGILTAAGSVAAVVR